MIIESHSQLRARKSDDWVGTTIEFCQEATNTVDILQERKAASKT